MTWSSMSSNCEGIAALVPIGPAGVAVGPSRSEERRVGKEGRYQLLPWEAEDGIRDHCVTGVQTCALPILIAVNHELQLLASGEAFADALHVEAVGAEAAHRHDLVIDEFELRRHRGAGADRACRGRGWSFQIGRAHV